jgi:hypothetical protein
VPLPLWIYKFTRNEQAIFDLVLKPLVESYDIVNEDCNAANYEENVITEKLVWYLKNRTSISSLYQKRTIDVLIRPKEQVATDEKYEPDIKFVLGSILWMEIETKRIYEKERWSTSEYLSNEDGVGRFLSGRYSRNEKYAGMIGYIQKGDFQGIIQTIKRGILKISCKESQDIANIDNCVLSIHSRVGNNDILIYHLFFYFS